MGRLWGAAPLWGAAMGLLWGTAMGLLWLLWGAAMGLLWSCYGGCYGVPCRYGAPLWGCCGALLWGAAMGRCCGALLWGAGAVWGRGGAAPPGRGARGGAPPHPQEFPLTPAGRPTAPPHSGGWGGGGRGEPAPHLWGTAPIGATLRGHSTHRSQTYGLGTHRSHTYGARDP